MVARLNRTVRLNDLYKDAAFHMILYQIIVYKEMCFYDSFSELCRINEHQKVALDLDPYVKKLLNARRRVVLVNNILQNAQVFIF